MAKACNQRTDKKVAEAILKSIKYIDNSDPEQELSMTAYDIFNTQGLINKEEPVTA